MKTAEWCEHEQLISKYKTERYSILDKEILVRVQIWICPECGVHGADTELIGDVGEKVRLQKG